MSIPRHLHRHLKRWFVPHKRNDHRPHLIRSHGLATMAILILGLHATAYALQSAPGPLVRGNVLAYATTEITPVALLNLTNQERAAVGLPALTMNAKLNQSSTLKGQNMFAENYWAHVSPSGIQPWYWFTKAGYAYTYAGENLAMDFDTASGAMAGWMASPGHKANILNSHYTEVGFSVQNGTLVGEQTTLIVAHYGARAAAAPVTSSPTSIAPKPAAKLVATPVPTAVPTIEATPTPSPTPLATDTPSPSPTPVAPASVKGETTPNTPGPASYSLFRPLSLVKTLNWNTLITIVLLFILFLVYVFTHLTVWRKGLVRWRSAHYRLYAAAQVGGLAVVIMLLSVSGFGRVS